MGGKAHGIMTCESQYHGSLGKIAKTKILLESNDSSVLRAFLLSRRIQI